eukprot:6195311-Pleurochrysis_carterae.AAC.1
MLTFSLQLFPQMRSFVEASIYSCASFHLHSHQPRKDLFHSLSVAAPHCPHAVRSSSNFVHGLTSPSSQLRLARFRRLRRYPTALADMAWAAMLPINAGSTDVRRPACRTFARAPNASVRACVRACVRSCVRLCACVYVRACVLACVCVRAWLRDYVHAWIRELKLRDYVTSQSFLGFLHALQGNLLLSAKSWYVAKIPG